MEEKINLALLVKTCVKALPYLCVRGKEKFCKKLLEKFETKQL